MTGEGTLRAIGLRVGKEEYGIELCHLRELIPAPRITRVPRSPSFVRGVINWHGNIIPVVDIARRFGIGETRISAATRVAATELEGEVVGLLAEQVSKVPNLSRDDIQPPPPMVAGIAADALEGIARVEGRFVIFLKLSALLDTEQATADFEDAR